MKRTTNLTTQEINKRIAESGVDACLYGAYTNMATKTFFQCSKGHVWSARLSNIIYGHVGCPYCSGRLISVGENDLWTTHPEIASWLKYPEDGYRYKYNSLAKVQFVCPNCGNEFCQSIHNVVRRSISCPRCSDGISYPNKLMEAVLCDLGIVHQYEYNLKPSSYRYDFYIPECNTIIEMHGRQHYEEWGKSNISLADTQENDKQKYNFALSQGVNKYIIIDSRNSYLYYIKEHILNSELSALFDMSKIDWKQCAIYASRSLIVDVAELYNSGRNVTEIANIINRDKSTVSKWLHIANDLGLCDYVPGRGFLKDAKQVICLNNLNIYASIRQAADKSNVPMQNISKVCRGERRYAGTDIETNAPLRWMFLEDYNNNTK